MGNKGTPSFGSPSPPRMRLVSVESREEESDPREARDAAKTAKAAGHPTKRDDGRSPNPRAAERAIAQALDLPLEALDSLARHEPE